MIKEGQVCDSKNQILKMIDDILGLEYFYVEDKETIVLKITDRVLDTSRWNGIID